MKIDGIAMISTLALALGCSDPHPVPDSNGGADAGPDATSEPVTFELADPIDLASEPRKPIVADIDESGTPDIVVFHQFGDGISTFLSDQFGFLHVGFDVRARLTGATVADFDGDDVPDLALGIEGESEVSLFAGDGLGGFVDLTTVTPDDHPADVEALDFDGDGAMDLAVSVAGLGGQPSTTVAVFPGDGAGGFGEPIVSDVGGQPGQLLIADVDSDGNDDIVAIVGLTQAAVLLSDGTAIPVDRTLEVGVGVLNGALFDADEDGSLDLVVADLSDGKVNLIPGLSGDFVTIAEIEKPFDVAVADLDSNDRKDLAVTSPGDEAVHALFNDGEGSFSTDVLLAFPDAQRLGGIVSDDFNADGRTDIAVVERGTLDTPGTLHVLFASPEE